LFTDANGFVYVTVLSLGRLMHSSSGRFITSKLKHRGKHRSIATASTAELTGTGAQNTASAVSSSGASPPGASPSGASPSDASLSGASPMASLSGVRDRWKHLVHDLKDNPLESVATAPDDGAYQLSAVHCNLCLNFATAFVTAFVTACATACALLLDT